MSATELQVNVNDVEPDEAVNRLVDHAAGLGVSDVFFGCNEDHVNVSGRHLGIMRLLTIMPAEFGHRCLAHLKGQAGMDVFERRRPQDGRWLYRREGKGGVDVRLNTIPTLHGEDCALRLLLRESRLLALANLGMLRRDYNQLLSLLNNPGGLILVSGPTGAGKTTTLYACLAHLNNGDRKINTIEDPIEYAVPGLRQSQVNPKIEVGFPELLRSVLRQSPDVVMVGEIRDPVSAETAVRAANSGHLVLATLHAPTAAASIQSLLSLGVHPHFLASSLLGVVAQRLIRTLCPECRVAYELADPAQTFAGVSQWLEPGQGKMLYGPKGCPACRGIGYAGQTGLFEVVAASRGLRQHVADRQPTQVIRQKAIEDGMTELRHLAMLKVAQGTTTIEEVFRTVPSEFLGVD
jgi:type II secretory ATPase GspE/PulE/Tfp pilus assembly ATPase PilB-like protein